MQTWWIYKMTVAGQQGRGNLTRLSVFSLIGKSLSGIRTINNVNKGMKVFI